MKLKQKTVGDQLVQELALASASQTLKNDTAVIVQTAVNGSYDANRSTLTLRRVNTIAPGSNLRWSTVRTQAFTNNFENVFVDVDTAPIATLVGHDADGDGRRSHHLVRIKCPSFIQSSNTITYEIELVNAKSPPPQELDRVFLFFSHGQPQPICDPEPLAEIHELAAAEIQEAFSAQTITGGSYDAATNTLSLRNVNHFLLVDRPFTESFQMDIADLVPELEEAYRKVATKPIAVLSLSNDNGGQQILLRLEHFYYDTASGELRYTVTPLESTTTLPDQFSLATLTIPPAISFGRGWPAHSVCCDCDAKCSVLWVLFSYCKKCVSPLGAESA